MSYQKMKYKRLIYVQTSIDAEVYLGIVRVLTRSQKAKVSEVSEVCL